MNSPETASSDVPIRPAATVMLLADCPDLHVLMLRRRADSVFVGGMSVFPGGGVDEEDGGASGAEASLANRRLGVPAGGLAYWMAAIRETFEDAGLLLARSADGVLVDLSDGERARRFASHRTEVDAGRRHLGAVLEEEALLPATDSLFYVARWITPPGLTRRYDTRFFAAAAPPGQQALPDQREAVHSEWVRPADALARFESGELSLLPPTQGMLRVVSGFGHREEALAAARAQQDGLDLQVRMQNERSPGWQVLLPGDAAYERGEGEAIEGWLRWSSEAALAGSPGRKD